MSRIRSVLVISLLMMAYSATYGQQLLLLNSEDDQPVTDAEVVLFHQDDAKFLISNSIGLVKDKSIKTVDSIIIYHRSFESVTIERDVLEANDFTVRLIPVTSLLPFIEIRGMPDNEKHLTPTQKLERIRQAEVRFQNPQTSADVVAMEGRLFVQKSQMGGGSPMIRGFAANNVLIVVDGVRMNNAIFREGNLQNIITIDPLIIQETELFYGPGSVIYGSDALGGVMAFQTKNPSIEDSVHYRGSAMLRTSSANKENSWHVDLEYGKNKVAGFSSISIFNYGDLRMGSNGPNEYTRPFYNEFTGVNDSIIYNDNPNVQYFSGYSQINVNQKFRFKPNDKNDLIAHFGYTTSSPIPRYDRLIQTRNDQPRYGDWFYGPQKWLQGNIRYLKRLDTGSFTDKMVITLAYQKFEESRHDRELFSSYLNSRIENVSAYTLNADFDKKIKSWDLMYGLEGVYNTIASTARLTQLDGDSSSAISTRYPNGSTWYTAGAYLSVRKEFSPKTELSIGTRFTRMGLTAPFSSSFYDFPFDKIELNKSAINGSVGVVHKFNSSFSIFANVSSGFRAPNVDDVGKIFDSEPGKIIVPNQNLLPEYSYSAETGLTFRKGDGLTISLNGYYTIVDNLIIRDNFNLNGEDSIMYDGQLLQVQSLVNSEYGTIYGGEIQIDWQINRNLNLKTTYNIIDGQTNAGEPIRHVTPNFGYTGLTYRFRRFKAQVYSNYHATLTNDRMALSEQSKTHIYAFDADGLPYSPSWHTVNVKAGFFISSSLNVNLGLENITDQRYRPYSSGISAPGRNLILSIYGRF